ncbi:MAG: formate C-acetyltransferase, partial [Eubacteriaceae bacterium]|nr:formate C-acetyltransferase [Eubacteriaceae bacterium]
MSSVSKRIQTLKDRLFDTKRELSLERARLYTESYKESEGKPTIIRRALATKHIMENVEIAINENELIVADRTVKPRSGIASPEMSPYWIMDEIDTLETRPQDKFVVLPEDRKFFVEELNPYWEKKALKDYVNERMTDIVKKSIKEGIVIINQTDKGQGHIIPSYDKLLNQGLDYMINEVDEKILSGKDNDFYEAARITLNATKDFILRYAKLAEELAGKENDEKRKAELEEIARISYKVAGQKPEGFYEALQLFWYVNIALQLESNASSISPGRFDQYILPFYLDSKAKGVDLEFSKELLRCLWLKMNDVVLLRSEESAKYFAGFPSGYTIILGGVDPKGRDATNELSYLILDTFADIRLPQPNLGIRIHEKAPAEFLIKTAETIRLGTGIPQVFNDEVIIPGYMNRGVSLEDSRDYSVVGCVELSIPGKTYGLHDIAMFNLLKVLEVTLENHLEEIDTFDKLMEEVKKTIDQYVIYMVEGSNITDEAHKEFAPIPLLSCFIEDCVEKGKDVTAGGAIYNFSG